MSIFLKETFEGSESGYDNPGWSEIINGTGSIDPDYPTPAGSPPGTLADVLRAVSEVDNDTGFSKYNKGSETGVHYIRFYFNIQTDGLSDGEDITISNLLEGDDTSNSNWIKIYKEGTDLKLQHWYYSAGAGRSGCIEIISAMTWYCYEYKYDVTNDLWEIKLDGITIGSGTLSDPVRNSQIFRLGITYSDNTAQTAILFDLLEWNDTHWPGQVSKNMIGSKKNIVNRPYTPLMWGEIVGN